MLVYYLLCLTSDPNSGHLPFHLRVTLRRTLSCLLEFMELIASMERSDKLIQRPELILAQLD